MASLNAVPNYSQVPIDPEKGQTASLLPAAHNGYSSVYLHGQPVSVIPGVQDLRAQRSRGKRFCVRLIHWLVLDIFFALIVIFIFKDFDQITNAFRAVLPGGSVNVHDEQEVHLPHDCVEVAEWNQLELSNGHHDFSHVVETSVDIPVSSDLLYFLGRGHLSHGAIQFVDTGAEDSDVAHVDVKFSYDHHELADFVKVCRLSSDHENKNGVGIFSPEVSHKHPHSHHAKVEIVVQLPFSAQIKALETHLPIFSHKLGNFRNSVFGRVDLKTSNSPITAEFLAADKLSVHTSNAHVSGIFNSSERIEVFTSNSRIAGEFYLSNDAEKTDYPSHIILRTSNACVNADVYLSSTLANHTKGAFNVDAHTSNSPLNVTFNAAPFESRVTFSGKTSNAHATATLHETFDGRFLVKTGRSFEAGVHVLEREDPSGEGKKRSVTRVSRQRGQVQGRATWGDSKGDVFGTGWAELVTSNSPAHLYL